MTYPLHESPTGLKPAARQYMLETDLSDRTIDSVFPNWYLSINQLVCTRLASLFLVVQSYILS